MHRFVENQQKLFSMMQQMFSLTQKLYTRVEEISAHIHPEVASSAKFPFRSMEDLQTFESTLEDVEKFRVFVSQ